MIEGALLFAAAAVRRLEAGEEGALAYPFGATLLEGFRHTVGVVALISPWNNPVAIPVGNFRRKNIMKRLSG